MGKLTAKQQQIFDFIVSFTESYGYPPSVREIGDHLGLKSPSTVHFHLKGLRSAGLIHQAEGKTRSITVTGEAASRRGKIPLVGHVAAGAPILAEELVEEYIAYQPEQGAEDHFALRVRGESMLNAGILPDDLVVVAPCSSARNGEIVVALFEDEATVKTYRKAEGKVWLLPENPDYEPIDGDEAEIIGKVVAVIRRY
jgi:repressor LexA